MKKPTLQRNIFSKAWNIDIYALNHVFSSKEMNILGEKEIQQGLPRKNILLSIMKYPLKFIKSLLSIHTTIFNSENLHKPVFFSMTSNQHTVLVEILRKTEHYTYIGHANYGENQLPIYYAYILSLPFIPKILYEYLKSKDYKRLSYSYCFDLYLLTPGYYIFSYILLKKLCPPYVLVSNDHTLYPNGMILAANELDIPTIYIQHAPVDANFPALKYTYAFLDGMDSLHKYNAQGESDTIVFLTGSTKMDTDDIYFNKNEVIETIGLCFAMTEQKDEIEELLTSLQSLSLLSQFRFIMRPHPADLHIDELAKLAQRHGVQFSDSRKESSSQFLRNVDCIIAGESGIHVEAAKMNVYPIYFTFKNILQYDLYGFIKRELITDVAKTYDDLIDILHKIKDNKPDVRHKAKYFYANIDTPYEGKAAELISQLLNEIETKGEISLQGWERIDGVKNLCAYKLKDDVNF